MAFRFANGLFEPIWNRDRIDHVQITVAETVGVEQRGKFYEATGALRDMVPNHVFTLLSMVAMEPPTDSTPPRSERRRPKCSPRCRPSNPRRPCAASMEPARYWQEGEGLSEGTERRGRFEHRDLCRHEARDR